MKGLMLFASLFLMTGSFAGNLDATIKTISHAKAPCMACHVAPNVSKK